MTDKIIKQHRLQGQSLLDNFILALQVELAELANAWRGFKHWSLNTEMDRDAALEEYADCLSFILEIGLELKIKPKKITEIKGGTILKQFNEIYYLCADLSYCHRKDYQVAGQYYHLFENFLGLGSMLGFSLDEIERAYVRKNAINHQRQAEGY